MSSTSGFELLAAIDLRSGRVVRLRQGDFDRETTYSGEPIAVAQRLIDTGATWLHVVDLDGARSGHPVQDMTILSMMDSVRGTVAVEVAGGRRTTASISSALDAGAARAVLGTAALRDRCFTGMAVAKFGVDRIAVALDVRGELAMTDGWTAGADGLPVERALGMLADEGVQTFEVTAVQRDGTLNGPDLQLLGRLVDLDRGRIIASGGIGTVEDLRQVRDTGCAGAIIGRALYEGRFDLSAALAMLS